MTPTTSPPITSLPTHDVYLDASSLKHTACQRRYNFEVVRGLTSPDIIEPLTFGKALHRYAEVKANGATCAVALAQALGEYEGKHGDHLVSACTMMPDLIVTPYTQADGTKYLERKFRVYWQTIVFNDIQYNIWVCGTFDVVTMFADGAVRIVDYKTSRKWSWQEVFASYRVSVQMQFYAWAAWRFGYHIFDMTVANQTTKGNVFVQICAVFLSQKPPAWKYGPPIQATISQLTEFEENLQHHLRTVVLPAWKNPAPTGMLNESCDNYCPFVNYCFSDSSLGKEQALAQFTTRKYDPMNF